MRSTYEWLSALVGVACMSVASMTSAQPAGEAETAIRAADSGDFSEIERLLKVLQHPFDEQASAPREYADFPPDWAQRIEVSCSS